jgi:DNA-binding NarL/FixJ family response regulator
MIDRLASIAVLIVDDHAVVAEGIRRVLEREPDFEVVAVAGTAKDAVETAKRERPDVVLMDLGLPDADGVTTARHILRMLPDTKIVILTGGGADEVVGQALQIGCVGYLEKTASLQRIAEGVRQAQLGEIVVSAEHLTRAVVSPPEPLVEVELTNRELEVLELLAAGLSNRDVAKELYLKEGTARTYVNAILNKLDAHTRSEAVAEARRRGILPPVTGL